MIAAQSKDILAALKNVLESSKDSGDVLARMTGKLAYDPDLGPFIVNVATELKDREIEEICSMLAHFLTVGILTGLAIQATELKGPESIQ